MVRDVEWGGVGGGGCPILPGLNAILWADWTCSHITWGSEEPGGWARSSNSPGARVER